MNKPWVAAATLAAALLAGSAIAGQDQPAPPAGRGMMGDSNGDGVITREEMLAGVDARFAKMDTNHDGKVSAEERTAARAEMAGRKGAMSGGMGRRGDTDGDGAMTLDEQHAQANKRFDLIDTNHDGKIDMTERQAARERMRAMRGRMAPSSATPAGTPNAPQGN